MSSKVKIKNDFEIFRKELEILYNRYLNNELSYLKLKEKIKILADKHKAILFRKDKFTNRSIILNLSKTRKIIKEYINLSVIEKIKRDNTFLFFWKSKKIKELKNIGIKDLGKIEELMFLNQINNEKPYFQYFIDFFVTPKWLNDYAHKYKIEKINSYRKEQIFVKINLNTYIEIIKLLLNQNRDIRLKFYGVLMAIGRRPVEVMKLSQFYIADKNHIRMEFIAKKRENNIINEVVFPVFADPELIINSIKEIRYMEQTENLAKELISSNLSYSYNRLFRQIFNNIFAPEESVYFCRAIYCKFSYLAFAPKNMEMNYWITKVLGHEPNDITTAFHYNRYVLDNLDDEADNNLLKLLNQRIYTYVRRKATYSTLTMDRLESLIKEHSIIDDNYIKTLIVIKDLMLKDNLETLAMVRGLNVKIRKAFKETYGYNYNYIKLTEYLSIIFNYKL
ncbi:MULTISPECIES: telomere resolvase [Borreliella]|uniref:Telomere resolvase ResT n=1 Tax=Borrelia garinii subsp. bavariensis (strain ATCC BAA-2496 / DSM 23469 / PBi) TaxID=290434 RepID=A0A7I6GV18_BORGP|nr:MULTISPECIES: telomere resolvase [Borreliella]AAT93736.1 conserved hypothetical protein [Borreliella bavariensis PBi]AZA27298.1 Telomere resolvase ResT [Borreliella bavariensis PBi]WLN24768.1 telomere resolvase [Borreliella bavariensis]